MEILNSLKDWYQNIASHGIKKKRVQKVKESCGCVCFCPKCEEPLSDNSNCETIDPDGLYRYTCTQCGEDAVFHFGIAPVPIYLEDFDEKNKE